MNYSMIFYIIGWILDVEAALLVPSLAVSLIYHESCALAFFITIVLCLIPGVILVRKQPKNKVFYAREGSVTVALSWIVMSIMGSIPFLLSGSITNPVTEKVEIENDTIKSKRGDHHGIGLLNVKAVVDKYGGDMVLSCDENEFKAVVIL